MRALTFTALATALATRNPAPAAVPGTLDTLAASAAQIPGINAAAVRGFSAGVPQTQWVKAKENFFAVGEFVAIDDFVEVTQGEAALLSNAGKADFATAEEVAAAQKKGSK